MPSSPPGARHRSPAAAAAPRRPSRPARRVTPHSSSSLFFRSTSSRTVIPQRTRLATTCPVSVAGLPHYCSSLPDSCSGSGAGSSASCLLGLGLGDRSSAHRASSAAASSCRSLVARQVLRQARPPPSAPRQALPPNSPLPSSWRDPCVGSRRRCRARRREQPTIAVQPGRRPHRRARACKRPRSAATCARLLEVVRRSRRLRARPPLSVIVSVRTASSSASRQRPGRRPTSRNAIAVGPSSIASNGSTPADSAARREGSSSTTEKRAPCSQSFSRAPRSASTVSPR